MILAQVLTDGTVGPARRLEGPDYAVTAELGRQAGGNLFHSFSQFDIGAGQSAVFSGPGSVASIIGRVTGGAASAIDGRIRSEIPGADLFLINPWGMVFGPGAAIEVDGSVFAGTADFIELEDGSRFSADDPQPGGLSAAAPAAFGFLEENPGVVAFQGNIAVPEGEAIHVAAGDISFSKGMMEAPGGTVSLTGIGGPGRVHLTGNEALGAEGGIVEMTGGAKIKVSGDAAGRVLIRGNRFVLDGQETFAGGLTINEDGGGLEVDVDGECVIRNGGRLISTTLGSGNAGDIQLTVGDLAIQSGGGVLSGSMGAGGGGDIDITAAGDIRLSQAGELGSLYASAQAGGKSGEIRATAANIRLTDNAVIENAAAGPGNGGDIRLFAEDEIAVSGGSRISNNTTGTTDAGPAGDIHVAAADLNISDSGMVASESGGDGAVGDIRIAVSRLQMDRGYVSSTLGKGSRADAAGGEIDVTAAESVAIRGAGEDVEGLYGEFYGIYAQTQGDGAGGRIRIATPDLSVSDDGMINGQTFGGGPGGNVSLDVDRLRVSSGGTITVSTRGAGDAGGIDIAAAERVDVTGGGVKFQRSWIYTATHSGCRGGDVVISTPALTVTDGAALYANTLGDDTLDGNTLPDGDAGGIRVSAERIVLSSGGTISAGTQCDGAGGGVILDADAVSVSENGRISTAAEAGGRGGDIDVAADHMTLSAAGAISAESSGDGDAGDINLALGSRLDLTDGGAVTTQAVRSDGGNISVQAREMVQLIDARLATSVGQGMGDGGNIDIDPDFVILDNSQIVADAHGGAGGNIHIVAGQFIATPDSVVSASSELGIDGTIHIDAPDADISGSLAVLPHSFGRRADLLTNPCAARASETKSSLTAAPVLPPLPVNGYIHGGVSFATPKMAGDPPERTLEPHGNDGREKRPSGVDPEF